MATKGNSNRMGAGLLLAAILIIAGAALMWVLSARYDTGESYPVYSSERADPLGTRALFEALNKMPGVKAERQFGPLEKVQGHPGSAILLCGVDSDSFNHWDDDETNKTLARFAADGGRLIIALDPATNTNRMQRAFRRAEEESEEEREKEAAEKKKQKPKKDKEPEKQSKPAEAKPKDTTDTKPAKSDKEDKNKDKKLEEAKKAKRMSSLASNLKISVTSREFIYQGKEGAPLKPAANIPLKSEDMPLWYSNVFLNDDPNQDWQSLGLGSSYKSDDKDKAADEKKAEVKKTAEPSLWHVVATKGERNMVMERRLGSGAVVICTDRYFLSNEALWKEPKEKFLSWLFGDATKILFEETHLGFGVGDRNGIMTLARRYHMHGLFLGGILLFALYIWRNASSLVPSNPEDDLGLLRADAVAGQSTASGLEGLLRRGVTPGKLLERCFEIWTSTRAACGTVSPDRLAKARAIMQSVKGWRQAPQAYAEIREVLHARQPSRPPAPAPTDTL